MLSGVAQPVGQADDVFASAPSLTSGGTFADWRGQDLRRCDSRSSQVGGNGRLAPRQSACTPHTLIRRNSHDRDSNEPAHGEADEDSAFHRELLGQAHGPALDPGDRCRVRHDESQRRGHASQGAGQEERDHLARSRRRHVPFTRHCRARAARCGRQGGTGVSEATRWREVMGDELPNSDAKRLVELLAAPFEPKEVKFKPQMVKNNRALAAAYIDARLVQDRLDEVLGTENWQDRYKILPDGSVMCRLSLFIAGRWVSKTDVGSPSEQQDAGDRLKAAFSDALKRAAVKFGIGRYLYRLPAVCVDYDPLKKQIVQVPQLPAFAIPKSTKPAAQKPVSALTSTPQAEPAKPEQPKTQLPAQQSTANLPASGQELHRRLKEYDAKLAAQKH